MYKTSRSKRDDTKNWANNISMPATVRDFVNQNSDNAYMKVFDMEGRDYLALEKATKMLDRSLAGEDMPGDPVSMSYDDGGWNLKFISARSGKPGANYSGFVLDKTVERDGIGVCCTMRFMEDPSRNNGRKHYVGEIRISSEGETGSEWFCLTGRSDQLANFICAGQYVIPRMVASADSIFGCSPEEDVYAAAGVQEEFEPPADLPTAPEQN
jgi:hypothetical protein